MNFVKTSGENLIFHLGKREKGLLLEMLKLYPLIPISELKVSNTVSPGAKATEKLLEEALAEHRAENKRLLEAMLSEPERFQESSSGYRLALTPFQVEWLLQVLNDVRVGSWILLGSPDDKKGRALHLNLKNAKYLWAMELCAQFQFALLAGQRAE